MTNLLGPVAVDFEVFYDKKCTIKLLGVDAYLRHPKAVIYLVSVVDESGVLFCGDPRDFDWWSLEGRDIWSHNAAFDRRVYFYLKALMSLIYDAAGKPFVMYAMPNLLTPRWRCTANLSVYHRAGRSLKAAVMDLLGLEISKDVRDALKGLLPEDMMERPPVTPGAYANLYEEACAYAVSDSTHCLRLAVEYGPYWPELERRLSDLTIRSSHRGLPLDLDALDAGIALLEQKLWDIDNQLPWINGFTLPAETVDGVAYLAVTVKGGFKPTSPKGLAETCRAYGIPHPPSTKEDDPRLLLWEETYGDDYPFVSDMRARRKANGIINRAYVLRDRQCNGWFSYEMKYFGAHTGRWSGGSKE